MVCECCNREFPSLNALTKHMIQHNKVCYGFYIGKYGSRENFPWNKLSDSRCDNVIICQVCNQRCVGIRGIAIHVLQHSSECFRGYISKFGQDRTKWPEHTGLQRKSCKDCGQMLKDPRSMEYCASCRHNNHNVMKRNDCRKKVKERMLSGGAIHAISKCKSRSPQQTELFQVVRTIFPSAIIEYPIQISKYKGYCVDIAVPEHMLVIEHDMTRTHFNKSRDVDRQIDLESVGWSVVRFVDIVPSERDVKTKIFSVWDID